MNTEEQISKRRRDHVARLPEILRDKVNTMLDDGFEYKNIIAELEKAPDSTGVPVSNNPSEITTQH